MEKMRRGTRGGATRPTTRLFFFRWSFNGIDEEDEEVVVVDSAVASECGVRARSGGRRARRLAARSEPSECKAGVDMQNRRGWFRRRRNSGSDMVEMVVQMNWGIRGGPFRLLIQGSLFSPLSFVGKKNESCSFFFFFFRLWGRSFSQ